MKTVFRMVPLLLCSLVGLFVLGRGIVLVVVIRMPGHGDVLRQLLEGGVFIAAGGSASSP
jgi:hypothetical protein